MASELFIIKSLTGWPQFLLSPDSFSPPLVHNPCIFPESPSESLSLKVQMKWQRWVVTHLQCCTGGEARATNTQLNERGGTEKEKLNGCDVAEDEWMCPWRLLDLQPLWQRRAPEWWRTSVGYLVWISHRLAHRRGCATTAPSPAAENVLAFFSCCRGDESLGDTLFFNDIMVHADPAPTHTMQLHHDFWLKLHVWLNLFTDLCIQTNHQSDRSQNLHAEMTQS